MEKYLELQKRASELLMALVSIDNPGLSEQELWELMTDDKGDTRELNPFYLIKLNTIVNHLSKNQ